MPCTVLKSVSLLQLAEVRRWTVAIGAVGSAACDAHWNSAVWRMCSRAVVGYSMNRPGQSFLSATRVVWCRVHGRLGAACGKPSVFPGNVAAACMLGKRGTESATGLSHGTCKV